MISTQDLSDTQDTRCGAIALTDGSVRWRVWAPLVDSVNLILIDGNDRRLRRMAGEERGYFSHSESAIPEGQRYAYSLNGGPERPDPASRWQPDGVKKPSAVLRTSDFVWSDTTWRGIRGEDLVFYEIHVGTFTSEGTLDGIIARLSSLRSLGVTAIELMPVAQFPGMRNWGYDGVHAYAPQNSYGGPHALQRLVNACHEHGLAIFLDVVYNHVGPEGSYLNEFGPYFTNRYHTPWGQAVNYDDRGSDAVRQFVCDNVRMWIQDYHFDGLRLDAVHAIYDFGPRHILREIKETADTAAYGRKFPVHIVAESDLNDVRLLLPVEGGGYGLDGQWSDDFHHTVHAYLTSERQGYYEDYGRAEHFPTLFEQTFVLNGRYSAHRDRRHGGPSGNLPGNRFVVCIQNHDQVGNRALGERLGHLISPPAQRLAASLLLLSPHLPLLFMGEEYGEEHPFQFFCSFGDPELVENVRLGRRKEFEAFHTHGVDMPDPQAETTFAASRLTWSWEIDLHKAGLRRLYKDLLDARRCWPALRDFSHRAARMLPTAESGVILELIRGGCKHKLGKTIQALFNLTPQPQPIPFQEVPFLLWTSEFEQYHGERHAGTAKEQLLPYECMVFGPSNWKRSL